MDASQVHVLRHQLAAIAYRAAIVFRDSPDSFGAFQVGDVKPAAEILKHTADVVAYALSAFTDEKPEVDSDGNWKNEINRFYVFLKALDAELEKETQPTKFTMEQVIQGPISDALTHIGQLAMLRRLAGSPVKGGSYMKADVQIGKVGSEQSI